MLDGNHALHGQAVVARSYDDRSEIEDSTLTMRGRSLKIESERLRFAGSFSTASLTWANGCRPWT